jgi:hypothetical protein
VRKYTLNENFFENIDSEEKAYWLGFISADGCIRKSGLNKKPCQLVISAKESDANHLQKLVNIIGRGKVCQSPGYDFVQLIISSVQLVEGLQKQGITERKTFTARPWAGPEILMPHYWRGMVDGDGSLYKRLDRNRWGLNLVGTFEIVDAFSDYVIPILGQKPKVTSNGNIFQVGIVNKKTSCVVEKLYGSATVALDRKQLIADAILRGNPKAQDVNSPWR